MRQCENCGRTIGVLYTRQNKYTAETISICNKCDLAATKSIWGKIWKCVYHKTDVFREDRMMRTMLWTVDFNTGARIYVSASTVKIAIKNAVERYNKDMNGHLNSADIDMVYRGKIKNQCLTCGV